MLTRLLFAILIMLSYSCGSTAGFYLTGAQLYRSHANGSNYVDPGSQIPSDYRYTTNNAGTGADNLSVTLGGEPTQSGTISFALTTGIYDFQFEGDGASINVTNLGMNLFFTDTDGSPSDNSYNPSASGLYPGDLTVTTQANSSPEAFEFVGANLPIMNYLYQGTLLPVANGNTSFVGEQVVTVTRFQFTLEPGGGGVTPKGSFRLSVTATPEPSTLGGGALALCGLAHWVKKRRQKRATK